MYRKTYYVMAAAALMLALSGIGMLGCPPDDNNGDPNDGTEAQFTVTADSLVADAHFGKLFAVTHDNSVRVFTLNQVASDQFLQFNFWNDTSFLETLLQDAAGVTGLVATEEDLSGLLVENDTLTFTITGMTDDLFTIVTPQFQTPSTFAALNAVPLPATGSLALDLGMFSLDATNKVITEPGTTVYVHVTITRL